MSDTPVDADALRQYLAGTKPDPSELRDLLVKYHTSFDAVKALLDHTNGTVQLLAAVFAGWEEVMYILRRRPEYQQSADEFDDQVTPWLLAQYKDVTGPDLLAVLPSAQTVPPDPPKHLLDRIATWFLENVPLTVLTDEVVAEMSIWMDSYPGPRPELGAGWPPENRNWVDDGCWLISRYLYNRFGEHGPSWDVFVKLYDTEFMSIGVAAAEVEELHNRFGKHGPSWKVLLELIVSQGLWIRDAADQVAYPHTLFGTDDASWTMFMGIHDESRTVAEVAEMVVAVEHA